MVELTPGSWVYADQAQIDKALSKPTTTAKARRMLLSFYTQDELCEAKTLTGFGGKKGLDNKIIEAIIGTVKKSAY